jgi:hypothetical protein
VDYFDYSEMRNGTARSGQWGGRGMPGELVIDFIAKFRTQTSAVLKLAAA